MSFLLFPPEIPHSKRIFDLCMTIPGIILISPILGLISLILFLIQGSPIVFKQKRPGYKGQPFYIYKFRTMTDKKDAEGNLLPDEMRITKIGRFLRAMSLDELPELFNILRGEMSLVGPRPLLMQYLTRYTPEQARRHDVLPGLTGWAQINGRNILSWEDKFKLDVWYVDHWSLGLDIKIIFLTVFKVIRREGISQPGHITSAEFTGAKKIKNSHPKNRS
jgi:sugar transferase EpsL